MKKTKTKSDPLDFISPIHKAGRQVSVYLGKKLAGFPAAPGELHLLTYLRAYGPCPVRELIRVFGYKNTTMTSMLDRLEKQSLIIRKLNPEDRRSFLVDSTSTGNKLAGESMKFVVDFDRKIKSKVSKADLRGFRSVMAAIAEISEIELRDK